MKGFLVSVTLALATYAGIGAVPQAPGATNKVAQPDDGNRFLFVVDTSSRMGKLDAANRQTLFDLIYGGVSEQMKAGDTFGIWTFNEKLYRGEFQMERWDPEKRLDLASQAARFLKQKDYSGSSDTPLAIHSIGSLMRMVKDVNVFLISEGQTLVAGTPFDKKINEIYEKRSGERRKAKVPFVTVLAARDATMVSASVVLPGEPIALPPPPPRLVQKPWSINSVSPPLQASAVPKQASGTTQAKPIGSIIMTRPVTHTQAATNVDGGGKTAVVTLPPSGESTSTAADPGNDETDEPLPPIVKTELTPKPTPAIVTPPATTQPKEAVKEPALVAVSPKVEQKSEPVQTSTPGAADPGKPLGPKIEPETRRQKNDPAPKSLVQAPPSPMLAATPPPLLSPQLLVLAGAAFLGGALALLLVVFRRLHKAPEPSIITRSMEQR